MSVAKWRTLKLRKKREKETGMRSRKNWKESYGVESEKTVHIYL